MEYIRLSEAARKANTDIQYLHKLIKKGELTAHYEQRGKLKYWYVSATCPRYQKLIKRDTDTGSQPVTLKTGHPIDWEVWEAMCKRGEEIVKRSCSVKTVANYRDYITRFFKQHNHLSRETLRAALIAYEQKETRERDFYTAKSHLYFALMTVAKYFVYRGYETSEFIKSLEHLRPQKKHTVVSRRCYSESTVRDAVLKVQSGKTKRNAPIYSEYNATLNTALIHAAFFTGARSSEICGIRLQDVDFKSGSIRLFGKGGKERYVGMSQELKQSIKNYLQHRPSSRSDILFLCEKGVAMQAPYLHRRIKRAGKWINEKMAPHDLRRTSITWMLNTKKMPLPIVRDAVGHSSLAVTNIYTKPTANDVINAMQQL